MALWDIGPPIRPDIPVRPADTAHPVRAALGSLPR